MKAAVRALALLSLAAWTLPAAADDFTLPFQVPDRRPALHLLLEFERRAAAGDWEGAADRLQSLLDIPADDPVVIRAPGFVPARFEGASAVARRLFDGLPAPGREAWERNSRGRAEELLARGLRLRREPDLREAARRYPAPDVRRRAHDALAQLALVRGDLRAARFQLESLLAVASPDERPTVLARLAFLCAQAGDVDALAGVRARAKPLEEARVESEGGGATLGEALERASRAAAASAAAAPRQFGGDEHGTGLSAAPPRPEQRQWTKEDLGFVEGGENDNDAPIAGRERARLRPVAPIVSHGFVYVNNGLCVAAHHVSGGAEAWRFDAPERNADWRDNFVATHTVACADGVVYAALPTRIDAGDPGAIRRYWGHTIIYPLVHRSLYAFDERTGEVLWSHETARLAGRDDRAEISAECVGSPPLVVGDDLIVASWTYRGIYSVRLVCYDRRTGRTRWRTPLVEGQQELNLFGRPVKELATGPLAELNGRIYFATGLGVAAAVEREDGRVAWISQYPQTSIPRAMQWHQTRDRDVSWLPSPVSATPAGVVMAPLNSADLVCFDPETGATRWNQHLNERERRYQWFVGATGGRAYVVGRRALAIDVATGKALWTGDAGLLQSQKVAHEEAVGQAVLTKDRLYVPTDRAVFALSTDKGAVEETWALPQPQQGGQPFYGNLVSADGVLLIVGRGSFEAYYRADDLRARMQARLLERPEDAQVRVEVGRAFQAEGRLDDAVVAFEEGLRLLPRLPATARDRVDASLRRALFETHCARAEARLRENEADSAVADWRAAAVVARDKGDSVRALLAAAEALGRSGRHVEEAAALRDVAARFGDVVTPMANGARAAAGALALFRLGDSLVAAGARAEAVATWLDLLERHGSEDLDFGSVRTGVRGRLADLGRLDGALVDAAVHERAKKAFDAAKAAGDVAALDRVARLYPDPQIAAEAALLAAETHLGAGRARDAVGVLNEVLKEATPPAVAARALWRLSVAYRALGETARERATLRRLLREAGDETLDGGAGAAETAERELAASRFEGDASRLPAPTPPLSLLWQRGGADQLAPQILPSEGFLAPDLDGRIAVAREGLVALVETSTGKTVWERAPGVGVMSIATTAPGALVVAGSDDAPGSRAVVAVALAANDGHELWRARFAGAWRGAQATLGVLYFLTDTGGGPDRRSQMSLTAVSLATGETLATKEFAGTLLTTPAPGILPAEDTVVVAEQVRSAATASARAVTRRTLVVLDGMTLSERGRVALSQQFQSCCLHPAGSSVAVTADGEAGLTAVDVTTGRVAWRTAVRGQDRTVKKVFGVAGALIVSDPSDSIRRYDAATGVEAWKTPLASTGTLVYEGEAAAEDVVVATLRPRGEPGRPSPGGVAVALDAATGRERWRVNLPASADDCRPRILATAVAYEINERLDTGSRSRILLLDRASGAVLQTIEHPTIGRSYQGVTYGPDWIAVGNANEVAVYGRAGSAK